MIQKTFITNNLYVFSASSAIRAVLVIVTLLAGQVLHAAAATKYWAQSGGAVFDTASDWSTVSSGTASKANWASGDIADFNHSSYYGTTAVTLTNDQSVGGLIFDNTGTTSLLSSNGTSHNITLNNANGINITVNAGAGAVTIGSSANPLALIDNNNAVSIKNNSSSLLTIGANITAGNSVGGSPITLGTTSSGGITISGVISGGQTGNGQSINVNSSGSGTVSILGKNTDTSVLALSSANTGIVTMGTTGTWTGSGVQVNGGTLLLGASGQLPSAGTMSMSGGGTLSLGGAGTTTARFAESTGALTLTGNSVIDFGSLSQTGTASLTFNGINNKNGSTLFVYNYVSGNTTTKLYDTLASDANISLKNIAFYSGIGTGFLGTAVFGSNSQLIVALPEPSVVLSAFLLLGTLLYTQRALISRYLTTIMGLCHSVFCVWK